MAHLLPTNFDGILELAEYLSDRKFIYTKVGAGRLKDFFQMVGCFFSNISKHRSD